MEYIMIGESYAGHYLPAFANALLDNINLSIEYKATLIGDPYTTGLDQKRLMYKVPEALNILDDSNMPQVAALRKDCTESYVADRETSY